MHGVAFSFKRCQNCFELGTINDCNDEGINVIHANATIGLATLFTGPTITNCTRGVGVKECSDARVDDTNLNDNTVGLHCQEFSRVGVLGTTHFRRNSTAVMIEEGGVVELGGTHDFHDNSVDSNTVNFQAFGFGGRADELRDSVGPAYRARRIDPATANHTGNTTETTIKTYSNLIRSNTFVFAGKSLAIKLVTSRTGTAGLATMRLKLGGTLFASFTIAADSLEGQCEIFFVHKGNDGANTQEASVNYVDSVAFVNNEVTRINRTLTLDDTVGDLDLIITVELANGSDSVGTRSVQIYETG